MAVKFDKMLRLNALVLNSCAPTLELIPDKSVCGTAYGVFSQGVF